MRIAWLPCSATNRLREDSWGSDRTHKTRREHKQNTVDPWEGGHLVALWISTAAGAFRRATVSFPSASPGMVDWPTTVLTSSYAYRCESLTLVGVQPTSSLPTSQARALEAKTQKTAFSFEGAL